MHTFPLAKMHAFLLQNICLTACLSIPKYLQNYVLFCIKKLTKMHSVPLTKTPIRRHGFPCQNTWQTNTASMHTFSDAFPLSECIFPWPKSIIFPCQNTCFSTPSICQTAFFSTPKQLPKCMLLCTKTSAKLHAFHTKTPAKMHPFSCCFDGKKAYILACILACVLVRRSIEFRIHCGMEKHMLWHVFW